MSLKTQKEEWLQFIRTAGMEVTGEDNNNANAGPKLSSRFGDASGVGAVHSKARLQDEEDHQQTVKALDDGTSGTALPSGRLSRVANMAYGKNGGKDKDGKRRDDFFTLLTTQDYLDALEERRQTLLAEIDELRTQSRDLKKRMDEIVGMRQSIDHAVDKISKGEGLERDENGDLKDKRLVQALHEYEKRFGKTVDIHDDFEIYKAIKQIDPELAKEYSGIETQKKDVDDQIIKAKTKVDDIEKIENHLKSTDGEDPDLIAEAISKLDESTAKKYLDNSSGPVRDAYERRFKQESPSVERSLGLSASFNQNVNSAETPDADSLDDLVIGEEQLEASTPQLQKMNFSS